jgi:4'-phosphopantetheinyl transferase
MKAGTVTVHLILPSHIPPGDAVACITPKERLRAGRFRFPKDALHWTACRASLRIILGKLIQLPPNEVPLVLSKQGKPTLAPPFDAIHFNLSHCPDLALVAVGSDGPIGIDLEKVERAIDLLECVSTFCHPQEIQQLPDETRLRARHLLRIWTAKEAVLKALGTGLSHPPDIVRIVFKEPNNHAISDHPVAGIERQRLHELILPGFIDHQVFVSAPDSVESIKILRTV